MIILLEMFCSYLSSLGCIASFKRFVLLILTFMNFGWCAKGFIVSIILAIVYMMIFLEIGNSLSSYWHFIPGLRCDHAIFWPYSSISFYSSVERCCNLPFLSFSSIWAAMCVGIVTFSWFIFSNYKFHFFYQKYSISFELMFNLFIYAFTA